MKIRTDFARKRRREIWKVTIAVGEGASFATWNSRHVYTSFNPNGTLSKNLHMTVWRFHVVCCVYVPWFPSIYTLHMRSCAYYIQRDARRRKNARCLTSTKVFKGYGSERLYLCRNTFPLRTAYRVCMKRFKYLNCFLVRQIFFVARNLPLLFTESERDESSGILNVLKGKEKNGSITRPSKRIYTFFFFLFFLHPIRYVYQRIEEKKKGRADLIPGRWQ